MERRIQRQDRPAQRPGVTINRRDLLAIPVPGANLLWRNLHVRDVRKVGGKTQTQNVRIDIVVDGVSEGKSWTCGLEFDYANEESFYCRPLRLNDEHQPARMAIPPEAAGTLVAFLPPMSGLAATEPKWEAGRINVLLGEGQTAQVLRNLCHQLYEQPDPKTGWKEVSSCIQSLFGAQLQPPEFIKERGEITMTYRDPEGCLLDLSCAGRGLQQTLLLLAHLHANPKTVLLLDEPDAHLEVLRQRQIYQLLTEVAARQGSQIIAASHSEVVLNEAANRDIVIAFVGSPHRMDDRGQQVLNLFGRAEAGRREQLMRECIQEITSALQTLGRPGPWSADVKASDDFLNPLFDRFFQKLGLPNLLRKTDYHALARIVPADKIDPEVAVKLDGILAVAGKARPRVA